jgi:methionyl-tRNA formyltransferase
VNTAYLGTSAFAAAVLERLADSPHRPSLVISRPDAPFGRGRKLTPPPVIEVARALAIEVFQPESVNTPETVERIEGVETVVVCAFGALIKQPLLSARPILNVHPSLLPRWRGAAPIERAILAGDEVTGVSIMQLTAGLDSGPVCLQQSVPVAGGNYGAVSLSLEAVSGELLVRALSDSPPFLEQDEAGVTYAEKITAEDRLLNPLLESASQLERRVRGLTPHIGAYLEHDGARLGVLEAVVTQDPGLLAGDLDLDRAAPRLGCVEGVLELVCVQPPGKRPMAAGDWLRGLRR